MEILLALSLIGVALFVGFVLPILSFLRASRALGEAATLRTRISRLEEQLRMMSSAPEARADAAGERPAPEASTAPVVTPLVDQPPAEERHAPRAVTPALAPDVGSAPGAVSAPGLIPTADVKPGVVPATGVVPVIGVPEVARPSAGDPVPIQPPVTPRPDAGAPRDPRVDSRPIAAAGDEEEGLESVIGSRLLLYVGTLVLVLGMAFFLKYAFDREWLTEWMRVALGALIGAAMTAGGLRLAARGYTLYGQILSGGGLAVLYLAVYAAFDFYGLIGGATAFALLLAVTVLAAVLSDRQRSQGMAVMAVGGGFLTPFLVGGTTDAQLTLFSYVALLVAGTMYLAHRREWPLLNVVSYVLTIVTVASWAAAYYSHGKYLRTELFLTLYCVVFLVILGRSLRQSSAAARASTLVLATAPVLYHAASLAILSRQGVAFLVYLIAFTLAAVGWAMRQPGRTWLRVLAWAAVIVPLVGWLEAHQSWAWMAPGLTALAAIFGLHLVAQFDRVFKQESALDAFDLALLHLNGLGLFLGVYILLEPLALASVPAIGAALVVVHAGAAWLLRARDLTGAQHALAVAFSLAAASLAVRLDGAWLTAAWAAEGAAVTWVGLRARRDWFRAAGAALLAVAVGRWLALSVPQTAAAFTLVLNETFALGAWIVLLLYVLAWLHKASARRGAGQHGSSVAALLVVASGLTVILLSAQNASYWDVRGETSADASLAEGLILSLIWAFYAGLLIVVGIRRRYAPIRYAAMALFGLTVVKVFAVDLSGLEGIYRVLGLVAVGAVLLLVSFLYQRAGTPPRAAPE